MSLNPSRTSNRVHHWDVQQELRFQEMLAAAQTGNREAIGGAYERLHPDLLRYLRAVAGAEAEDIAAQSWLDVVAAVSRFEGDEMAFRRWVFTIARRRVADSQRRWWRRPRSVPFDGFDEVPGGEDIAADTVDQQRAMEHTCAACHPSWPRSSSSAWWPDSLRTKSARSQAGRPRRCGFCSTARCTAWHAI
jgi:hypothetical protein